MELAGDHTEGTGPLRGDLPGFLRLVVDPATRAVDDRERPGGRILIGGSPLRLVRLNARAAAVWELLGRGASLREATASGVREGPIARFARRLLDNGMAHPRWPAAESGDPNVTIVIPVRDRSDSLARLVASIVTHSADRVKAIVVVDDGSAPPISTPPISTPPISARPVEAPAREPSLTVLRHPRSLGPAAARNTGLRAAATPLVAFVDSDCVVDAHWLDRLLPHFGDPSVAIAAPRIRALDPPRTAVARFTVARSPLDMGARESGVRPRGRVTYVPSTAIVARVEAVRAVGGFDPDLRYGEDVDLVWRLVEAGWGVRHEPAATVFHDHRATLGDVLVTHFRYGTAAGPLDRRHPGQVPPLAMSAWSLAGWGLVATQTAVGAAAGAATLAGSVAGLARKLGHTPSPIRESLRLAGKGHLFAAEQIANAAVRTYLPVLAVAALGSRRARRLLAFSVLVPGVMEWRRRGRPLDPARFLALRAADDAAYGLGVWRGCLAARTVGPLTPDLGKAHDPTRVQS